MPLAAMILIIITILNHHLHLLLRHHNPDEKDMVKQKIEDKTKLAMGKRKREVVTQQVSEGIIEGLRGPALLNVRCFNDCGLTRVVTQDSHSPLYDNWIGCTICPSWFCGKTRCLARFKKYHIMCLSHK